MVPQRFAPVLAELAPLGDIFRKADRRLYVVGGTVRDLLLDRQMGEVDFDFTTNARPEEMEEVFRWMYDNLSLWSADLYKQDQAIVIIRDGIAKIPLVADQEINLSATLIELGQLS